MPWQDINLKFFAKSSDFRELPQAIECAKGWLDLMKRKDGRDEFIHAERTAQIYLYHVLRNESKNSVLIKNLEKDLEVCLFHDVGENISSGIFEYMESYYEEYVVKRVGILTIRKRDNPEKYFQRVFSDLVTALIKVSDRLHNLRNMTFNLGVSEFFTERRLSDQIKETEKFIMPMSAKISKEYPQHRSLFKEMRKELLYSIRDAVLALEDRI